MTKMLFQLGGVVITTGAQMLMNENGVDPVHWLARHVTGDWGDMDEQDKKTNDAAVNQGGRIFSAYNIGKKRIWVITESDRSVTTILKPEEY